jgi:CheY-like chemotaxis protein
MDVPLEALRATAARQLGIPDDRIPGAAGMVGIEEPGTGTVRAHRFDGKRILVIEDEVMVALDVVDMLEQLGVQTVGTAHTVEQALAAIADGTLDAALLDANLAGAQVDVVAAALTREDVPFVFVTGYSRDSLPTAFRSAPILSKPFSEAELIAALRGLFGAGTSGTIPLRRRPGAAE